MEKRSIDRVQGKAFLRQSNKLRYGQLLTDLTNQYSQKNDQYPKDLTESYNLLVHFKSSIEPILERRQRRNEKNRRSEVKKETASVTILAKRIIRTNLPMLCVTIATNTVTTPTPAQNRIKMNKTSTE